jgi:hypothetical protein
MRLVLPSRAILRFGSLREKRAVRPFPKIDQSCIRVTTLGDDFRMMIALVSATLPLVSRLTEVTRSYKLTADGEQIVVTSKVTTLPKKTTIRISVQGERSHGTSLSSAYESSYAEDYPMEVLSVTAVRIGECSFPSFVAWVKRSNWLDCIIYRASSDDIQKTFSFSCRDQNAVGWFGKKKILEEVVTLDKFEPVPPTYSAREKGDGRFLKRTVYRWDDSSKQFKIRSTDWTRYHALTELPSIGLPIETFGW